MRSFATVVLAIALPFAGACLDSEPSTGTTADEIVLDNARHTRLGVGAYHACAITRTGGVRCWGAGTDGQLGDGAAIDRRAPVDVSLPSPAVAVTAGNVHTCAVLDSGSVACWGEGSSGQLGGTSDSPTPVIVAGVSGAIDVAAGMTHTCALLGSGRVVCWGWNAQGQLGDGSTTWSAAPRTVVTQGGQPLGGIVSIQTTGQRTCGFDRDGITWCWSNNQSLNLSPEPQPPAFYTFAFPTTLQFNDRVVVHDGSVCRATGTTLNCWGAFSFYAYNIGPFAQVEQRERAVCYTTYLGSVICGGDNDHGQRGLGHASPAATTSSVPLLGTTLEMGVGVHFACALGVDGNVRCWGKGDRGQTGDGSSSNSDRLSPVLVAGGASAGPAWELAVGSDGVAGHACVLRDSGAARCVGDGRQGQKGNGSVTTSLTPTDIFALSNAVALSARVNHTCALAGTGGVSCWGQNARGQLGDGSYVQRTTPSAVRDLANAVDVGAGANHTCAARSDGRVVCWGENTSWQLGINSGSVAAYPVPRLLTTPTDVISVDAGFFHSCAIKRDGGLWCWGRNTSGETGAGVADSRRLPAAVAGLDDVVDVALGWSHSCALIAGGTVRCWGNNAWGQLGDGTTSQRLVPITPAIDRVVSLVAGSYHTCALRDDGTVRCWGYNGSGNLGVGDASTRYTPTQVTGTDRFVAIAASSSTTCGLRADGTTACWGHVGDNATFRQTSSPSTVAGL
jgi:alpha-tubulin suppressor-like RCC1 family protein